MGSSDTVSNALAPTHTFVGNDDDDDLTQNIWGTEKKKKKKERDQYDKWLKAIFVEV